MKNTVDTRENRTRVVELLIAGTDLRGTRRALAAELGIAPESTELARLVRFMRQGLDALTRTGFYR